MAQTYRVIVARPAGDYYTSAREVTCTCDWRQPASDRASGALQAARHLRHEHQATALHLLDTRRRTELFGYDPRLLSGEENRTLAAKAWAITHPDADPPTARQVLTLPSMLTMLVGAGLCLATFLALILLEISDDALTTYAVTALILTAVLTPVVIMGVVREQRALLLGRFDSYVEDLAIAGRTLTRPASSQSSGPSTRRSEQRAWYGDNSHMDWRHRAQAETYGLDADTYRSNMLEHDKD